MTAQLRFLAVFAATVVAAFAALITFNLLVDPLWYFGGSQLTPYNEPLTSVSAS